MKRAPLELTQTEVDALAGSGAKATVARKRLRQRGPLKSSARAAPSSKGKPLPITRAELVRLRTAARTPLRLKLVAQPAPSSETRYAKPSTKGAPARPPYSKPG